MSEPPEDVVVARELLDRIDVDDWARRTEGPAAEQPWLSQRDFDHLSATQVWLASRTTEVATLVQAAVANFARVLSDFIYVFDHDLDGTPMNRVPKWYRRSYGQAWHERDVESFELHVLLIRHLAAEMTRALNLIIARCREASPDAMRGTHPAAIDTGAAHNGFRPALYTDAQAQAPQPYPGLPGFPSAIPGRDLPSMGDSQLTGEPRTPEDFTGWIEQLRCTEGVPPGGDQPPAGSPLPLSLPAPAQPSTNEGGARGSLAFGSVLLAAWGWVTPVLSAYLNKSLFVVLAVLSTLAGAALWRAVAAWRPSLPITRWQPGPRASAFIALVLVAGAVVAFLTWPREPGVPEDGSVIDAQTGKNVGKEATTRPRPPYTGQIDGGQFTRICNVSADRQCAFARSVSARRGDRLRVRARLHNGSVTQARAESAVNYLKVQFSLNQPGDGGRANHTDVRVCLEWPMTAASDQPFDWVSDHTTIKLDGPDRRLRFVPGSAKLLDRTHERLARLPDAIVAPGGTTLKNVGAPRGCVNCDLDYVRYVDVDVDVT